MLIIILLNPYLMVSLSGISMETCGDIKKDVAWDSRFRERVDLLAYSLEFL